MRRIQIFILKISIKELYWSSIVRPGTCENDSYIQLAHMSSNFIGHMIFGAIDEENGISSPIRSEEIELFCKISKEMSEGVIVCVHLRYRSPHHPFRIHQSNKTDSRVDQVFPNGISCPLHLPLLPLEHSVRYPGLIDVDNPPALLEQL